MRNSVESLLRESYSLNIKRQRGLCTVKCFSLPLLYLSPNPGLGPLAMKHGKLGLEVSRMWGGLSGYVDTESFLLLLCPHKLNMAIS